MKVKIEINADTIADLYTSLHEIRKRIRKQTFINKSNPAKDDFPAGACLADDNCYGDYELEVFND